MNVCKIYDVNTTKVHEYDDMYKGLKDVMYRSYEYGPQLLVVNIEGVPKAVLITEGKHVKTITGTLGIELWLSENEFNIASQWCIDQVNANTFDDIDEIVNNADSYLINIFMRLLNTDKSGAKDALKRRITTIFKNRG